MTIRKSLLLGLVFTLLALIAACTSATPTPVVATATPVVVIQTVVVKETVPVEIEKTVEVIVTKEVEKEVEKVVTIEVPKEVTVIQTVEVEKEVPVVETVEVVKVVTVQVQVTPTLTPEATTDRTDPKVREVLSQITLVQYHHDPDSGNDSFTCASRGQGLEGVKVDPQGPRFVGPNSADFDLWGVAALFKVNPDGSIELVPQQSGGKFVDPEGIEHQSVSLEQALELFASGDAKWLGTHGEAGHVADCDPQYVTPTPTP
jgi:hypothetical protein